MKVDQEINLLNGITFADGVELVKTEIELDGKRTTISDPSHYVPEYPGTCSIIFTVKGNSGESSEIKLDNLTIKPLDYKEAPINTANMINEKYPWYNNLQQSTKDFIYPHLIASYAACNRSKQDNRIQIIMGETADVDDIENIGNVGASNHGLNGYHRIKALSPNTPIKACLNRENVERYIDNHPNDFFIISLAADFVGGNSLEELNSCPGTAPLRRILEKGNVIVVNAASNKANKWKIYNENIKTGNYYRSTSINSTQNNKITAIGYKTSGYNNYFSPGDEGLKSNMPVGYQKNKGNIVMPTTALIGTNDTEDFGTESSYPTAIISGIIGNAVSVIINNHPGISPEDAMTIIVNNYLIEKKFQYMDETTNGNLVDGGYWYFLDMEKLLKAELLKEKQINSIALNKEQVELPRGQGICYMGKGILFAYKGKTYETTEANQALLTEALKTGDIRWYWNRTIFQKYSTASSATFDVYVVDKQGQKIPDTHLSITKNIP